MTKVVFTHAHPDHIWGTLGADDKLFNAERRLLCRRHRVGLLDRARPALEDAGRKWAISSRARSATSAAVKDRVTMVKAGDEIAPGHRRCCDNAGPHARPPVAAGERAAKA